MQKRASRRKAPPSASFSLTWTRVAPPRTAAATASAFDRPHLQRMRRQTSPYVGCQSAQHEQGFDRRRQSTKLEHTWLRLMSGSYSCITGAALVLWQP